MTTRRFGEHGRGNKARREVSMRETDFGAWVGEVLFWSAILGIGLVLVSTARSKLEALPPPPRPYMLRR